MKKTQPTSRILLVTLLAFSSWTVMAQQPATPAKDSTVAVKDSVATLNTVVISSQKQFMEQSAGKIILNVAASPVAAGGNAYDVLVKAPGMMEQQDILQFRSKSINVLINGRPSNLTGEELKAMLQSMPANTIEKIEILSNPSAVYDAQGGTVVNIKLARNKNLGTNGTVTTNIGAGKYGRYSTGLSLNHRTAKTNVYGSYDFMTNDQYSRTKSERALGNTAFLTENEYSVLGRESHNYKTGVDYDINKTSSIGILVKGLVSVRKKDGDNKALVDQLSHSNDSSSQVLTNSKISINNPSVNLYYKSTLDKKGKELTINGDYFSYAKNWNDHFVTRYLDEKQQRYASDYLLRNKSEADIQVMALSADYMQPLKAGKLEAGIKTMFTTTDNDASWSYYDVSDWKTDAGKTNHFVYRENINAAYINYTTTIKKFSIVAGLRAEYTRTEGESKTLNQVNINDYLSLFPTASVSYNASEKNQFGLSYRRSITRFGFDVVNPFVNYISQYSYSQGNPAIRPSFGNSIELSHTYKNKLSTSLGYSAYTDMISPVFKKDASSNAVISRIENLNSARQLQASVSYMNMLLKGKWMISNTVGGLYAEMNGPAGSGASSSTTGLFASLVNSFTFNKGLTAELSANYISPITIGVLKIQSQGSVNIGLSKSLFKKAGKLTLGVYDIFNTQQQHFTVSSFGVSSVNKVKIETRYARITFSWKFGNKNVKASKTRKTGIEEAKGRTESN